MVLREEEIVGGAIRLNCNSQPIIALYKLRLLCLLFEVGSRELRNRLSDDDFNRAISINPLKVASIAGSVISKTRLKIPSSLLQKAHLNTPARSIQHFAITVNLSSLLESTREN